VTERFLYDTTELCTEMVQAEQRWWCTTYVIKAKVLESKSSCYSTSYTTHSQDSITHYQQLLPIYSVLTQKYDVGYY